MSDRWDDVSTLFEGALERSPDSRAAWLDEKCGDDSNLRREVERMLAAHGRTGGILDRSMTAAGGELFSPETDVGPYRILHCLGRGGMGVVYKAWDPRLERFVALKVLPPSLAASDEASARFQAEARAVASLDHANVCTIYDVGTLKGAATSLPATSDRDQLYLAMAYYDGPTLDAKIEEGGLPVDDTLQITHQIAQGLSRAHEAGIIHRDLKPSNLILTEHGTVKILDFGIAKLQEVTGTGEGRPGMGTMAYMAPEQIRGEVVGPETDLWALGVVLCELLTGRHPFRNREEASLRTAIQFADPPTLPLSFESGSDVLDKIARTALAKEPMDRYSSAADLVRDLDAARSVTTGGIRQSSGDSASPGALPAPLTSFVGRAQEVTEVKEAGKNHRLLTLTGPAGTGKTRLTVRIAKSLREESPYSVFFVPLAPVSTSDLVPSAIAQAVGVDEVPDEPLEETLIRALQAQNILLILDNFEQVLSAGAFVRRLLAKCPSLRVMVTSRTPLRVSGEQVYTVPPLEVPSSEDLRDPKDLEAYASVDLFLDRATAVSPDFGLSAANMRPIAELCRRLDGLPLAIELAAARVRLFTPQEMLDRLGASLDLLADGPRDRPRRHQTLRQAIAWSYDLLSASEKRFFRWMSVFVDGFRLDAAEGVTRRHDGESIDAVEAIAQLVDRNLLRREETSDGTSRYVMLEMIRTFGLEQLRAEGEFEEAKTAHLTYFLSVAEEAERHLTGPDQAAWFDRLEAEHENFRAALSWAVDTERGELGLRLGSGLWRFWAARNRLREGYQSLARLLRLPHGQRHTEARARALNAAGTLLHEISDCDDARTHLQESLQIYRDIDDPHGVGTVLNNLGWNEVQTCNYDRARALSTEALELFRDLGSKRDIALSLNNLGWVATCRGNLDTAQSLLEESLSLRRELQDERGTGFALTNLGWVEHYRGTYDRAEDLLAEALQILEALNDKQLVAWTRNVRALVQHAQGHHDRALHESKEGLPSGETCTTRKDWRSPSRVRRRWSGGLRMGPRL